MYKYRGPGKWGRRRFGIRFRKKYRRRRGASLIVFYAIFIVVAISGALVFGNLPKSKDTPPEKNYEENRKDAVINSISRSLSYQRGMDIINYVWDYVPTKNGRITSSEVELPEYLRDGKTKKVSGIPYCWGGYLSLDISNKSEVENFQDAISKGYVAGNVFDEGGYKDFTAGLDCSGFVSAVYKLPEKCSTQTLKYYFDKIDIKDLKPMDIFNSEKKHTFIFIKETPDKKGVITMESTTSKYASTKDKTVINYRNWEDIKKGVEGEDYVPMRYRGITEDKVETDFDEYEFNDTMDRACTLKSFDMYRGTIDYVDDVDYFKFSVDKKKSVNINILGVPSLSNMVLVDSQGNTIETFKDIRLYSVELDKGTYYIKISAKDFKFNPKDEYIFYVGN